MKRVIRLLLALVLLAAPAMAEFVDLDPLAPGDTITFLDKQIEVNRAYTPQFRHDDKMEALSLFAQNPSEFMGIMLSRYTIPLPGLSGMDEKDMAAAFSSYFSPRETTTVTYYPDLSGAEITGNAGLASISIFADDEGFLCVAGMVSEKVPLTAEDIEEANEIIEQVWPGRTISMPRANEIPYAQAEPVVSEQPLAPGDTFDFLGTQLAIDAPCTALYMQDAESESLTLLAENETTGFIMARFQVEVPDLAGMEQKELEAFLTGYVHPHETATVSYREVENYGEVLGKTGLVNVIFFADEEGLLCVAGAISESEPLTAEVIKQANALIRQIWPGKALNIPQ